MKLYVFGNEYLEEDSMARKVASHLVDVDVVHCRSPEELLEVEGTITILDVLAGASKPLLITDVTKLKTRPIMSMHDFDLGFFLNLLKELGQEKHIRIVGIPQSGDAKVIAQEVQDLL